MEKWEVLCQPKSEGGLGFKDLEKFNDAMLAKQVRRLLKDQSSLFYRVFKVKYFPKGSIFEASVANGSYAWQSILKLRKVISMGTRWRIGDGKSIDIYRDNWLPGKGSAKVVSPHVQALEGAQVAALINPSTRTWNINLLHQHFLSFEANRIKAIPLCWIDQKDCLIWPDSHNGEYKVKAGYQKLCQEANSSVASTQTPRIKSNYFSGNFSPMLYPLRLT